MIYAAKEMSTENVDKDEAVTHETALEISENLKWIYSQKGQGILFPSFVNNRQFVCDYGILKQQTI